MECHFHLNRQKKVESVLISAQIRRLWVGNGSSAAPQVRKSVPVPESNRTICKPINPLSKKNRKKLLSHSKSQSKARERLRRVRHGKELVLNKKALSRKDPNKAPSSKGINKAPNKVLNKEPSKVPHRPRAKSSAPPKRVRSPNPARRVNQARRPSRRNPSSNPASNKKVHLLASPDEEINLSSADAIPPP